MPYWFRFIRPPRTLKPNEVQAKVPMLLEPVNAYKRVWGMIPVRDPEIYPLIVCVFTGVAMLGMYCVHNFMKNPDININKTRRKTPTLDRYEPVECQTFVKHRAQLATLRTNPINTAPEFQVTSDSSPHQE